MQVWFPTLKVGSGADVFVERLAAGLCSRGVQATITWFSKWYELAPDLLRSVSPPAGTDIIHANASYAYAFKRPGTRLVATELHYLLDPAFRPFKSLSQHAYHRFLIGTYLHRSFASADAVTAISHFTGDVLAQIPRVKVTRVVPLWVDMQQFVPAAAARELAADRPFRLLFVGNGSRRKGADVLPELAQRLGPGFEIYCTAGLRQQMKTHDVDNIHVLGRLDTPALVREYQLCDAVLVPSRYEGFGYAALEGMACAKPVVGFASGAVLEVVGDEGAAFLAEINDIAGLAERCRKLAADRELCRRLGEHGRQRALSVFSETAAVSAYVDLYERLLREASSPR